MPTNEILAPYYLKVRVNTGVARHTHKFYFQTGCSMAAQGTTPVSFNVVPSGGGVGTPVVDIVAQIFTRMKSVVPPGSALEGIEIWQAETGANNFLAYNPLPTGLPAFTGVKVAASYYMMVFEAANRQKYRLMLFDGVESRPQRLPFLEPPAVDDGSMGWYAIHGNGFLATQDGGQIVRGVSENIGYNRALAKRYGRQIVP